MRWSFAFVGALAVALLLAIGLPLRPHAPPAGTPLQVAGTPILGIWDGHAYAYIVPTAHGAILVDTGADPAATALDAALHDLNRTPADVQAILLTCGHIPQRAAADHFPNADVYIGSADLELVQNQRRPRALLPRITAALHGRHRPPQRLQSVLPGTLLHIDDLQVEVISLPGHTPGSTAYVTQQTAFVGHGLASSPALLPSRLFDEQTGLGERARPRLMDAPHKQIADAWSGWQAVSAASLPAS